MSGTSEVGADFFIRAAGGRGDLTDLLDLTGACCLDQGEPGVRVLQQTKISSSFPNSDALGASFTNAASPSSPCKVRNVNPGQQGFFVTSPLCAQDTGGILVHSRASKLP